MSLAAAAGRVARAPVFVLAVAVAQWGIAKLVALPVVAGVAAATEGFAPGVRPAAVERILAVVAELLVAQPAIAATLVAAIATTAVVSFLSWTLLSAGVIARLAPSPDGTPPDLAAVGARGLGRLPAVLAQSAWHLLLRAAIVVALLTATGALPGPVPAVVIGITIALCIVALDLARAGVVVGEAAPFHPRTAFRALLGVLRTPGLALPAGALAAAGLLGAAAMVLMALWALSNPMWLWGVRALSAVTLGLGLVRIAFIAGHPALASLVHDAPNGEADD